MMIPMRLKFHAVDSIEGWIHCAPYLLDLRETDWIFWIFGETAAPLSYLLVREILAGINRARRLHHAWVSVATAEGGCLVWLVSTVAYYHCTIVGCCLF